MKTVVVTGYNGYIGSVLSKNLIEYGHKVIGIDTNYFDAQCEFYEPELSEVIKIQKDIRDISKEDLEGADTVCHLAALSNDPVGELNPSLTFDINKDATIRLAQLSKSVGVKDFIFSSSCSLYGIEGNRELDEESKPNPITAYAKSKVIAEEHILSLNNDNFYVTSLRNGTAYGLSPKLRLDLVVNNMVGWAMTTGEIKILSDGTPWRPLVHVEDIASAFKAVIEDQNRNESRLVLNVGLNGENYQIKNIAEIVLSILPKCKVIITAEHGSDSRTYKVKFDKIHAVLPNYVARWTLRDGVEQIVEGYKKHNMTFAKFDSRFFYRLKQIRFLIDNKHVDHYLYWNRG